MEDIKMVHGDRRDVRGIIIVVGVTRERNSGD